MKTTIKNRVKSIASGFYVFSVFAILCAMGSSAVVILFMGGLAVSPPVVFYGAGLITAVIMFDVRVRKIPYQSDKGLDGLRNDSQIQHANRRALHELREVIAHLILYCLTVFLAENVIRIGLNVYINATL